MKANGYLIRRCQISSSIRLRCMFSSPSGDNAAILPLNADERSKDYHFMKLAIRHAQFAFREKEVPIGAVVVDENGVVLAAGRNSVEAEMDCTCHAEIDVIRKASKIRNNWRLKGCTIYTTLEPCTMCMSAIQASRIDRLVYGANDSRLGACGSRVDLCDEVPHPYHTIKILGGVAADEAAGLLKRFFQSRRRDGLSDEDIYSVRGIAHDNFSSRVEPL